MTASAEIGETRDADAERAHGSTLVATGGRRFTSCSTTRRDRRRAAHAPREVGDDAADVAGCAADACRRSRAHERSRRSARARRRSCSPMGDLRGELDLESHSDLTLPPTTTSLGSWQLRAGERAGGRTSGPGDERDRSLDSFAHQESLDVSGLRGQHCSTRVRQPSTGSSPCRRPSTSPWAAGRRPHGSSLDREGGWRPPAPPASRRAAAGSSGPSLWGRRDPGGQGPRCRPTDVSSTPSSTGLRCRVGRHGSRPPAVSSRPVGDKDRLLRAVRLCSTRHRRTPAGRSRTSSMWRSLAEAKAAHRGLAPRPEGTRAAHWPPSCPEAPTARPRTTSPSRSSAPTSSSSRRPPTAPHRVSPWLSTTCAPRERAQDLPTTALLAAGAGRAPALATSDHVRAGRQQERLDALMSVVSDRDRGTIEALGAQGRRGPLPPPLTRSPVANDVAEGRDGRLGAFDALPRGLRRAKVVETEADLRALFDELTHGAGAVETPSLDGERLVRSDGVEVIYRRSSTSGGPTIDLEFPDGTRRKVHIR